MSSKELIAICGTLTLLSTLLEHVQSAVYRHSNVHYTECRARGASVRERLLLAFIRYADKRINVNTCGGKVNVMRSEIINLGSIQLEALKCSFTLTTNTVL